MIVPMKKVFLIVQKKDVSSALETLRELSLVHIDHQEMITADHLASLRERIGDMEKVVSLLKQNLAEVKQDAVSDVSPMVKEVLSLQAQVQTAQANLAKNQEEMNQWQDWGDFNPQDIADLACQGVYVYLAEASASKRLQWPENALVRLIGQKGKNQRYVIVSREKVDAPFILSNLPSKSLSQMMLAQKENQIQLEVAQKRIFSFCPYLHQLEDQLNQLLEESQLKEIALGMKKQEDLAVLKGFCPADQCESLKGRAGLESWGLLIEDLSDDDLAPTLIRNPRWLEIVKPVFSFINVLPGYKERDISFIFLIFFSMFFGMLVGDAAYGLIILALTFFAQKKFGSKIQDHAPFVLFYVLASCTIVWGLLTGTFLGTLLLGGKIKPIVAWLTDSKNLQLLCFLIGTIHLTLAHSWRCKMKWPAISAFAEIGWTLILWSSFFLANMMILGIPAPFFIKYIFLAGVGAVILDILTGDKSQIVVNIIIFIFGCISAFTDIVSYVRLFAVGLAGVAVADAFNQIALSIGFNDVISGILTVVILIVGHLFNIVLCGFGILVHGLRLNVLEFSGHLGLEWLGFPYKPYQKLSKNN